MDVVALLRIFRFSNARQVFDIFYKYSTKVRQGSTHLTKIRLFYVSDSHESSGAYILQTYRRTSRLMQWHRSEGLGSGEQGLENIVPGFDKDPTRI